MLMPKATMDKDYLSAKDEHEVGLAREVGGMENISVAHRMGQPPYAHFRCGVLAANCTHACAALFRSKAVRHTALFLSVVRLSMSSRSGGGLRLRDQDRKCHFSVLERHQ
jgi:hypothetical protein